MTCSDIHSLLEDAQTRLQAAGSEDPRANAEFLLAHVLGVTRTWLAAFSQEAVPADKQQQFEKLLLRHAQGEPLAYIVGFQPFCGLDIAVTPAVLIPRPETESLAQFARQAFDCQAPIRILDLCTGSGCLALALARFFKKAHVTASDVSPAALEVAQTNARTHNLADRITFVQSDLFEHITGPFDLMVSNPPYIPSGDLPSLAREVQREPALALDGGVDGLAVTRRIAENVSRFAAPGCVLGLELCLGQPARVARLLGGRGWNAEVKKDIFGIDRFVFARKI